MNSFSRFRMYHSLHYSNERSLFFDKETLRGADRLVNYFENHFVNQTCERRLSEITIMGRKGKIEIDELVLNRSDIMSEYLYDDFQSEKTEKEYNSKLEFHDINLRIFKFTVACKLMTVYASSITSSTVPEDADRKIKRIYYKLIDRYNLAEVMDEIVYYGSNLHSPDKDKLTPDYDYNEAKEDALFLLVLEEMSGNPVNADLQRDIAMVYNRRVKYVSMKKLQTSDKFATLELIKNTMSELNTMSISLEMKNKIMRSLTEITEDEYFDYENNYSLISSALVYMFGQRPNNECQKLLDKYKDTHSYKGVVYHGFSDKQGKGRNIHQILRDYKDGFISCTKDLQVALKFADVDEIYGLGPHSGILEILVDENVENVDIEKLLQEKHDEAPDKLYEDLYGYYIEEQEVMVKMPIISYNILSYNDVKKRLDEMKDKPKKPAKGWVTYVPEIQEDIVVRYR